MVCDGGTVGECDVEEEKLDRYHKDGLEEE